MLSFPMQMRLAGNKNIVQYIDSSFEPVRGAMVEAYLLTEYCPGILYSLFVSVHTVPFPSLHGNV